MAEPYSPQIMRHVPAPGFLASKIDDDVRRALQIFADAGPRSTGPVAELGKGLRRLAILLGVNSHATSLDLLDAVVGALRTADSDQFRTRTPEDRFVRGKGERIWTASTALFATVERLVDDTAGPEGSDVVSRYHAPHLPAIPATLSI